MENNTRHTHTYDVDKMQAVLMLCQVLHIATIKLQNVTGQ
jgi:hypothetical protein